MMRIRHRIKTGYAIGIRRDILYCLRSICCSVNHTRISNYSKLMCGGVQTGATRVGSDVLRRMTAMATIVPNTRICGAYSLVLSIRAGKRTCIGCQVLLGCATHSIAGIHYGGIHND